MRSALRAAVEAASSMSVALIIGRWTLSAGVERESADEPADLVSVTGSDTERADDTAEVFGFAPPELSTTHL